MELACKTKPKDTPQGKPRVYFTCHPDDFNDYFEKVSNEILTFKGLDCAIYYKKDSEDKWTVEEMNGDLMEMKLFVIPVTERLLSEENAVFNEEYQFAQDNHKPVLFLMQEENLEKKFREKFDDVQFLSEFNDSDPTAIPYGKKLQDFLFSVLLGDELEQKVRDAFDAYIFMSYRKVDRKQAQELMRLIHRNVY